MTIASLDRRSLPGGLRIDSWTAPDGWLHRRFGWPPEPGTTQPGAILFQAGRGDFLEKYVEALSHWHDRGWWIDGFDWRGQGGSGRLTDDSLLGHVDSLDPLLDDLDAFVGAWRHDRVGPHILIGHSMGGNLLLRLLAERKAPIAAAVLISPMLGLNTGAVPDWLARRITGLVCRLGFARQPAWRQADQPPRRGPGRQANLTSSRPRYEDELWWKANDPRLAIGAPSWGWLRAAYASIDHIEAPGALEHVTTPILLVASRQDRLVRTDAVRRAARRLPNARLIIDHRGAHELLREDDPIRQRLLDEIDGFLAGVMTG